MIGASILLLALMLFSELSCSLLGLCTDWFPLAEFFGFWEMMGISIALVFTSFSIRALRRSQRARLASASDSPAQPVDELSALLDEPASNVPAAPKRTSRWRDLFNQLSDEEKRKLKTIMEEHCVRPDEQQEDDKPESSD